MNGDNDLGCSLPQQQALCYRNLAVLYILVYAAIKIVFVFSGVNLW